MNLLIHWMVSLLNVISKVYPIKITRDPWFYGYET